MAINEGTTVMARKSTTIAHEKSSGNIFADLGLPHPEAIQPAGIVAVAGSVAMSTPVVQLDSASAF